MVGAGLGLGLRLAANGEGLAFFRVQGKAETKGSYRLKIKGVVPGF